MADCIPEYNRYVALSTVSLLSALTVACYYYRANNAIAIPREGEVDLKDRVERAALRRQQEAAQSEGGEVDSKAGRRGRGVRSSQNNYSRDTLEIVERSKMIQEKGLDIAHHSPPVGGVEASLDNEALVCNEGGTGFWIIPTLPDSDHARRMLSRMAKEFLPIILQRGYRVRSVSEYYRVDGESASDGLHFELGGEKRTVQPENRLQKWDMERTLGYNRQPRCMPCSSNYGRFRFLTPECTIHLRLRKWHDANSFMTYEDLVATMAHELAHCVHPNHKAGFWKLNEELLEDYNKLNNGCVEFKKGDVEDETTSS